MKEQDENEAELFNDFCQVGFRSVIRAFLRSIAYLKVMKASSGHVGQHCDGRQGWTSQSRMRGLTHARGRRLGLRCSALFEKFTERSIRAVLISQREARRHGCAEVCCSPARGLLLP